MIFKDKPSTDVITQRKKSTFPNYKKTVEHYKQQYAEPNVGERIDSPIFNQWINKTIKYRQTIKINEQLEEQLIKSKINAAILQPWKAPG